MHRTAIGSTCALLLAAAFAAPLAADPGGAIPRELAGQALAEHPWIAHHLAFNQGSPVWLALDTRRYPELAERTIAVYVVAHRDADAWSADATLADARGAVQELVPTDTGLPENVFVLDAGSLVGETGNAQVGVGYDVVLDLDGSGTLSEGDWTDGGDGRAGFYVMPDLAAPGPYTVVEELFSRDGQFAQLDLYYPSEVAGLGELPLVMVSHGNGHNYRWYDHIGYHLASWGYVVVSHANNTGPGPSQAASTTLQNTELFLTNLDVIAGGALQGHVDSHRMTWIGHSRGGEGVVLAHRRLVAGNASVDSFTADDVKLISSIAPTDFRGRKPQVQNYHLWTGGADSDVNGCANCDICQTFHFYERAEGKRMSISLHGVGHGAFHDGGGNEFAQGPCRVGRETTHTLMRGVLLPLLQAIIDGNPACEEYLWRQWEDLHPIGAPADNRCVIVDLQYQQGPAAERLVVDDFQRGFDAHQSSSEGVVAFSMPRIVEGVYDDRNGNFTPNPSDPMNGMTLAGPGDTTRGAVVEWDLRDEWMLFELPGGWDLRDYRCLSFRAAQTTRQPLTDAEPRDLTFCVRLWDAAGHASRIHIGAYGGGVAFPYQRHGCGDGAGWANDFETVTLELAGFLANGAELDLGHVVAVEFLFGPTYGSPQGRIGLDEIEFRQ